MARPPPPMSAFANAPTSSAWWPISSGCWRRASGWAAQPRACTLSWSLCGKTCTSCLISCGWPIAGRWRRCLCSTSATISVRQACPCSIAPCASLCRSRRCWRKTPRASLAILMRRDNWRAPSPFACACHAHARAPMRQGRPAGNAATGPGAAPTSATRATPCHAAWSRRLIASILATWPSRASPRSGTASPSRRFATDSPPVSRRKSVVHVRSTQAHFENERELMEGPEMLTNRVSPEHTGMSWADAETVWLPAVANQSVVPFWLPGAGRPLESESGSLSNSEGFTLPVRNRKISLTPLPETLLAASEEEGSQRALPGLPLPTSPLHLDAFTCRILLELQGPSLGLWRAAEIAALREQSFERPILDVGCGDRSEEQTSELQS